MSGKSAPSVEHPSSSSYASFTIIRSFSSTTPENLLNFGGQNNELWVKGGEETFVRNMAKESQLFGKNCFWFTTLVAKKANLASVYRMLHSLNPVEVKTITMAQGQKESRIVAWTFLSETEQQDWIKKRWKATK